MIKLIAVDLDGTLLNKNGLVSEVSKNYLRNLKDKGYIIVIATGRMYTSSMLATPEFCSNTFSKYQSIPYIIGLLLCQFFHIFMLYKVIQYDIISL